MQGSATVSIRAALESLLNATMEVVRLHREVLMLKRDGWSVSSLPNSGGLWYSDEHRGLAEPSAGEDRGGQGSPGRASNVFHK